MKRTLIALLVLLSLLTSCSALASELPNPASGNEDCVTLFGSQELEDGYVGWVWEHTLDPMGCEALMDRFIDKCKEAGFLFIEQSVDDEGDPRAVFSDGEQRLFSLFTTDEAVFLLAPGDMSISK